MRLAVIVAGLMVSGCGGGLATAPSPPPVPEAVLQLSGEGSFANCIESPISRCDFHASIQNVGSGCATSTTVVARFYDGSGNQVGSDAQMGAPATSLASRTIRPVEIVALESVGFVPKTVADGSTS